MPWASLGRAPVLVELDRLYLLAGPKQEFEDSDPSEEQVVQSRLHVQCHLSVLVQALLLQDFDEAEQVAKRQRVADAELAATQVRHTARALHADINHAFVLLMTSFVSFAGPKRSQPRSRKGWRWQVESYH